MNLKYTMYRVSAISGKSGKCQKVHSLIKMSGNCQGNLFRFCNAREMLGKSDSFHWHPRMAQHT